MHEILAQAPQDTGFNILRSLQSAFTTFVNYLPQLIGALIILVVGYLIAKILNKIVTKLLQKARLDERMAGNQGGRFVEKVSPDGKPSRLIGGVVFWVIMLFVISSAIGALGIPALTNFMNLVLSYLPNVLAALLIFVIAAAVAGLVGGLVQRTMGDTTIGKVVGTAAPALIMAIAVVMILTQLGIAPVIVTVTYVALIGALALASALAFGLGGRDAAARLIESGYRRAQEESETVGQHARLARERGERDARQATGAATGPGSAEPGATTAPTPAPRSADEGARGAGADQTPPPVRGGPTTP